MPPKPAAAPKRGKKLVKTHNLTNVSFPRTVLDLAGNLLNALIIEFIDYRVQKNNGKPIWLQVDWFLEALPCISRSGMAKRLKMLVRNKHVVTKQGEGRHYHKVWYSLSPDMTEACRGENFLLGNSKVYYNPDMAKQDLEASVVYATIVSLLKVKDVGLRSVRGIKERVGVNVRKVGEDKLLLDNAKLVEGTGLSLRAIRRAVKWLIDNKKIVAKTVFGNKKLVSLPASMEVKPRELKDYFDNALPTESYWEEHALPKDDLPTEYYEHQDKKVAQKVASGTKKVTVPFVHPRGRSC